VGNITTGGQVRSDFNQYWDQITPENEGKWGSVEGTRDQYNWGGLDAIYNHARAAGIPVKAHTFVWGNQRPGWIDGLSAADQRAEIEEWMRDYCARYPDTAMIDVVNEALSSHAPAAYAQNAFGNDWITESFRLARQHCPNAILIYNDYNFLTWDTDAIMNLIRPAVNSGFVDAVGVQAHSLYSPQIWTAQQIQDKLDLISTLGVPIYVSEYDIEATNDQTQLQHMQTHFPIFYNHSNVAGITLWGYVVGSTWREGTGLIQSNGTPRPAMTWLMNYLGR
jgi:GH35 family endo-1,4-beta-xylanase